MARDRDNWMSLEIMLKQEARDEMFVGGRNIRL